MAFDVQVSQAGSTKLVISRQKILGLYQDQNFTLLKSLLKLLASIAR